MHRLIRYSESPSVPWANGHGRTTELITWEGSRAVSPANTPDWRLSVARLDGPAPFSPIAGVLRDFLPIGVTLTLSVNGTRRRVRDRTVTAFGGADDVTLLDMDHRPGHAVNLMVHGSDDNRSNPRLVVRDTDSPLFTECLVAVALESDSGVGIFDVVTPAGSPRLATAIAVALIHRFTD